MPAHLPGQALDRTLNALGESRPQAHEVIVVADGGHPAVVEAARRRNFRSIAMREQSGPAAARNIGTLESTGDVIFFVDSDVEVKSDSVAKVLSIFDANPDVDAIIGSYDDSPPKVSVVSWFRNMLHHYTHQDGPDEVTSFWSGCGAIRRATFLSVGGFDEDFDLPSIEDIDLGYRLHQRGIKVKVEKSLVVKHLKEWTFVNMVVTDTFRRAKPWVQLMRSKHHFPVELNINHRGRINAILAAIIPIAILGALLKTGLWPIPVITTALLIGNNYRFYALLLRKGGFFSAAAGIGLHWVHLACALVGGTLGALSPAKQPDSLKSSVLNFSHKQA